MKSLKISTIEIVSLCVLTIWVFNQCTPKYDERIINIWYVDEMIEKNQRIDHNVIDCNTIFLLDKGQFYSSEKFFLSQKKMGSWEIISGENTSPRIKIDAEKSKFHGTYKFQLDDKGANLVLYSDSIYIKFSPMVTYFPNFPF